MPANDFNQLLAADLSDEAFVRRALDLLELTTRELALLAVSEWEQLELSGYGDLLPVLASMDAPTWGTWNGLLKTLHAAREQVMASGTSEERSRVEHATGLAEIVVFWNRPLPGDTNDAVPTFADAIASSLELANRLKYGTAPEPAWWHDVASGLRGMAKFLATDPLVAIRDRVPRRAPWFVEERGEVLSFQGRGPDFSASYTGQHGAAKKTDAKDAGLTSALGRLLGVPHERELRQLLARHAPEEIRGVLLGDFLVGRPIGEGGFGVVHIGRQLSTGRKVAIKLLHDGMSAEIKARFAREAGYLARFNHPNIVSVLAHGEGHWSISPLMDLSSEAWFQAFANSAPVKTFIAMEWVEGQTLESVYQQARQDANARPSIRMLADWFAQSANALAAVHASGLVHRDVKPGNLMISEGRTIKLMDFGIARLQEPSHTLVTTAGRIFGTIMYMSPEQIRMAEAESRIGPSTDIYSLCATFYELFTRTRLYEHDAQSAETVKTLKLTGQRPQAPRKRTRDLPWEVEVILLGGLEAEVADRYRSMESLERDLRHFLQDEAIEYRRPALARRIQLGYRRHRAVTNVVAVGLLAAVLGTGFYIQSIRQEQARTAEQKARALAERDAAQNNAYAKNISLAYREWQANNLSRARQLLEDCPKDLRRMEWNYVQWLCNGELIAFHAHDQGVRCVAVSPDGQVIATASDARAGAEVGADEVGQIRLWDTKSGKMLRTIPAHKAAVTCLAFSPEGRLLSAADGEVRVWEAGTGQQLAEFHGPYRRVAFAPDGRHFAFNQDSVGGTLVPGAGWVKVWDMDANREQFAKGTSRDLRSVESSPDGKLLAAADLMNGQNVDVWDLATGKTISTFRGDASGYGSITFSPDSRFLLARIGGHPKNVELSDRSGAVMLNPHGPGRIQIWEAGTGRVVYAEQRPEHALLKAIFSPDGQHFAAARDDGTLEIWDLTDLRAPQVLRGHGAMINDLAFTPDGLRLVSADSAGDIKVWDITTHQDAAVLEAHGRVTGMGFTQDGKSVVASTTTAGLRLGEVPAPNDVGQGIRTWSLASGQITNGIDTGPGFDASCLSPAGDLMVASIGRRVVVMQARDGVIRAEIRHDNKVTAIALSSDGRLVYSADEGSAERPGELKVWRINNGELVKSLQRTAGGFGSVAVEPGGSYVAAGGSDGTVDIWETAKWLHVVTLPASDASHRGTPATMSARPPISALAWNGPHTIAVGDDRGNLSLWDVPANRRIHTLPGHTDAVLAALFDAGGERLITSSRDKTLKIWDPHTGQEVLTLRPHGTQIEHVALSRGGLWLASSGDDQKIRIYPIGEMTTAARLARSQRLDESAGPWRWYQMHLTGTAEQWYPFAFHATELLAEERKKPQPNTAEFIRLLAVRADAYRKLGQPDKALADYAEGVKLGDSWAWQEIGYVQGQLGHWNEARQAYAKAAEQTAMSARSWRPYALLQLRAKDLTGYRKFCGSIADHASDPDRAAALEAAWACVLAPNALSEERGAGLVRAAEKLWAADPRSHKALTILGAALLRSGQFELAGEKLLAALKAGGEDVDIADELFLSILLQKQAKPDDAANLLADAKKRIAACREAQANDPTYQAPSWVTWLYVEQLEAEAETLVHPPSH